MSVKKADGTTQATSKLPEGSTTTTANNNNNDDSCDQNYDDDDNHVTVLTAELIVCCPAKTNHEWSKDRATVAQIMKHVIKIS